MALLRLEDSSGDSSDDDNDAGNDGDADVQQQSPLEHPLELPTVQGKAEAVGRAQTFSYLYDVEWNNWGAW